MVCDFYLPSIGGVESHILQLSTHLIKRGHRIVIITHQYPNHNGVHLINENLKVYYLPIPRMPFTANATLPNFFAAHHLLRRIIIRENVSIVHGHAALSSLAHEALMHSRFIDGVRTVFTDHSLFGFKDVASTLTNKMLRFALCDTGAIICVSKAGMENTKLRAHLNKNDIHVIPNAIISEDFEPCSDNEVQDPNEITNIVTISRLYYRKGIDLLIAAAPRICKSYDNVNFIVGGDGPRMTELERMRERFGLQDRIELLGNVPLGKVRDEMTRGHIYLNTSLTESFGIVLLEAASTGLFVVSTKVGGIPEVLPEDMIEFSTVEEEDIVRAIEDAIAVVRSQHNNQERRWKSHQRIKEMYSWENVAQRTEEVYNTVLSKPPLSTYEKLERYRAVRKLGIPDSNIILMLPDDIACNVRNRYPGSVYANKDHKYDLYDDETEVDYRGYEVTVENLLRLLTGRVKENVPNSKRLNSDQNSNVLLYLTGHGGDEFLKFQDTEEMNAQDIAGAIDEMHIKKRYNKLLFISDTCQASTLANRLYSPNVLAIGSSLKGQNSYSHHTDRQIGVGVIEGFTHFTLNALNGLEKDSNVTLQDFIDSFDTRSIKSTPGVRSDLFNSDLNRSLLTDFFSSSPDIEELPHLPPDIGIKEDHLNVIENEDEIVKLSMENQEFEKEGTISIRKLSNTIYLIASVSLFLISIVLVNIS